MASSKKICFVFRGECFWPNIVSVSRSGRRKAISSHPEFPEPTFGSHMHCCFSTYCYAVYTPTTLRPDVCTNESEFRAFLCFHPWRPSSCVKGEDISSPGFPLCQLFNERTYCCKTILEEFQIITCILSF